MTRRRDIVLEALLDAHDSEDEPPRVDLSDLAKRIVARLDADPDAVLVRAEFAHAPTPGTKIAVLRGIGGMREGDLLEAAHRLAGGGT